MALARGFVLGWKSPLVLSVSRGENMNPVVRTTVFAGKSFLIITALLCAIWWATLIYIVKAYGLPAGALFALASVSIPSIIYGMIQQQRRRQQHRR